MGPLHSVLFFWEGGGYHCVEPPSTLDTISKALGGNAAFFWL